MENDIALSDCTTREDVSLRLFLFAQRLGLVRVVADFARQEFALA